MPARWLGVQNRVNSPWRLPKSKHPNSHLWARGTPRHQHFKGTRAPRRQWPGQSQQDWLAEPRPEPLGSKDWALNLEAQWQTSKRKDCYSHANPHLFSHFPGQGSRKGKQRIHENVHIKHRLEFWLVDSEFWRQTKALEGSLHPQQRGLSIFIQQILTLGTWETTVAEMFKVSALKEFTL